MSSRTSVLLFILFIIWLLAPCSAVFPSGIIENDAQGETVFREARAYLARLGVIIDRDILLKVRPYDEIQVQHCSTGGRSISVGGYYRPYDPETIWIVAGQSRVDTAADMVHELTHAWQSTNAPQQDRMISEGFAMWCQYKVLLMMGQEKKASYLLGITDPDYGDGLRLYIGIEAKGGLPAVLEFAKTATKQPGK